MCESECARAFHVDVLSAIMRPSGMRQCRGTCQQASIGKPGANGLCEPQLKDDVSQSRQELRVSIDSNDGVGWRTVTP